MATHGWGKSAPVIDSLFEEGDRFDFFQAVALLEAHLAPPLRSVGESAQPSLEVVRFKSTIALSFPETDVASVKHAADPGGPGVLTVNFLGLAGALGPLPMPIAERVLQRAARGDTALRDFLDIFNHRLLSILYRSRKRHRVALGVSSPEQDDASRYLAALIGLGIPALRDRVGFPDRALLHHAGSLSREVRSVIGLEALLRHHFGVAIKVHPLTGCFCAIERSDWSTLGPSGKNHALGRDAVLGTRVWDQEAAFDIQVGPLDFEAYLRFLPGGDALGPLCDMARFYAGDVHEFRVRLVLRAEAVKPARLGKAYGARLGLTAWLGPEPEPEGLMWDDREIVLEGAALVAARRRDPRAASAQRGYARGATAEGPR